MWIGVPRGKKTIASRILASLETETDEKGVFLVFYDFTGKASFYFYKNLKIIQETLEDGEKIQKSVLQCKRLKTARAIQQLAKHYKADVLLYRAEPLE